jgi:hypothetical protein
LRRPNAVTALLPQPQKDDYFSLRRRSRRNEKYFLFALLASPEAGFGNFPAPALKKAKLQFYGHPQIRLAKADRRPAAQEG